MHRGSVPPTWVQRPLLHPHHSTASKPRRRKAAPPSQQACKTPAGSGLCRGATDPLAPQPVALLPRHQHAGHSANICPSSQFGLAWVGQDPGHSGQALKRLVGRGSSLGEAEMSSIHSGRPWASEGAGRRLPGGPEGQTQPRTRGSHVCAASATLRHSPRTSGHCFPRHGEV